MAVIHHAFRCGITSALEANVRDLVAQWEAGDRSGLSTMAFAHYAMIADRGDLHAAFHLHPDGAVSSWLQPPHISPGLAALLLLAPHFISITTLSSSSDTNHHLLATQLPELDWSADEINFLIHGQPIETMLHRYASTARHLPPGAFRHTGGWTPPSVARKLKNKIDRSVLGPPSRADAAQYAWKRLKESNALDDACAMMASVNDDDWLVLSTTH
ncbi:hypothetical protein [Rhizobium sp. NPDC090279]|uniref:hypothetical protein n=1 Tax=Rhizobium sp. NPDC090279 TaxID=3364499 RepID=UPI00383B4CFA